MKHLAVSCAVIEQQGKILVVQRNSHMHQPLQWEFPGGKVEEGESAQECIVREIKEELGIKISILQQLELPPPFTGDKKTIQLAPFVCRWESGSLQLFEHRNYRWLLPQELLSLDWCPADIPVVKTFLAGL
ncbi:(deoxy)nucleoside triphosphate pyrophosphohydrolase [Nafulsella turpanensis]|uniref:(deoxy)nucleoside triphosphate pyrophosphohydrolase n=1 Tax=Nafulsella turpanensis TaxID=1265690 RepID=UPI000347EF82|nr:(deoxy)nucleoside triphosphate pyrophosphohydrolase [Nafulsella turpanensis]